MPDRELEIARAQPVWQARVAAAQTIPREMTLDEHYVFIPDRFENLSVPTLLLLGGDSPEIFKKATDLMHQTLPNSRIVTLQGQQHTAMNTAPEMFTSEVLKFLLT
jgi:pimeloyl-ACP methyl ester carboxylesterase